VTAPSADNLHIDSDRATASFPNGSVVQLASDSDPDARADVVHLHDATINLTNDGVSAVGDGGEWSWPFSDLDAVVHGHDGPWTILAVPDVPDFGVSVSHADVSRFRGALDAAITAEGHGGPTVLVWPDEDPAARPAAPPAPEASVTARPAAPPERPAASPPPPPIAPVEPLLSALTSLAGEHEPPADASPRPSYVGGIDFVAPSADVEASPPPRARVDLDPPAVTPQSMPAADAPTEPIPVIVTAAGNGAGLAVDEVTELARLEARNISAWFGTHHVLDRVSLDMSPGKVTALIGPSGCGKSTFLRILNRMHEMIPGASLAGEVLLDGADIYHPSKKLTDARRQIGMVFQKPNPFPAMSIYDNVVASFRLTGTKVTHSEKDDVVESCLTKAGVWTEVRDRLRQPGGSLSGGQQQRLCIARALAIRPRVLLMDEPCSALDPTSTRRIEQTITELRSEVTIVIVTHNMQQAARVSAQCAFFLAEQGTPGVIVEYGATEAMFHAPQDERTLAYVNGRFG
jgi:phosphate transport system ATP-binding protein